MFLLIHPSSVHKTNDRNVVLMYVYILLHILHALSLVPFCVHGEGCKLRPFTHDPGLSDVAPTVLSIMGLDMPPEMTGQSLLAQ